MKRPYATLRKRSDFRRVFRLGSGNTSRGLTVLSYPGTQLVPRVGFVTRSDLQGAVQRNRAKRRLREAVKQIELRPGRDYVIVISASTLDSPFSELVASLVRAHKADD